MSIFNDDYPVEITLTIQDLLPGGKFESGRGLTYQQALNADIGQTTVKYPCLGLWQEVGQINNIVLVSDNTIFAPQFPALTSADAIIPSIYKIDYQDPFAGSYGYYRPWTIQTNPLCLNSLKYIKELKSFRVAFTSGGAEPDIVAQSYIQLYVKAYNNFSDSATFKQIPCYVDTHGHFIWYLREFANKKIFEFKLTGSCGSYFGASKISSISLEYDSTEESR